MEPNRIGRYDIKSLIGQGGMSTVYLGYDPRSHRNVAIKVLPPYYLHASKYRERFEREALTITLLEHPAIVPVYDMGEDDGAPYIVMRYMSGGSLAELLKKGAIPLVDAVEMFTRLAQAIDAAHAKGVIHRDVKPDNVLFDQYGTVFLSDFGLARLRESLGFAKISDGSIMGTPAYMSPEQIQGDREVDGRSDIYSLGVVLYHMLSGMTPFHGSTAASIMMMHLINPVPHVYEKNEALPTAIQVVLDISMAKKPDDRYQTAGEMARALQDAAIGFLKGEGTKGSTDIESAPFTKPTTMIFPTKELDGLVVTPEIEQEETPTEITPPEIKPIPSPKSETVAVIETTTPVALAPASTAEAVEVEQELPAKRSFLPRWAWITGAALLLIAIIALIISNPGRMTSTSQSTTIPASALIINSTATSKPLPSPTPLPPAIVLGQADKIAFINDSEIWTANLDGSGLLQLTDDGAAKANLQWSPDGQSVLFSAANCINSVSLETLQIDTLICFDGVRLIDEIQFSPESEQIAISLNEGNLYIVPYDQLLRLRQNSSSNALQEISTCPSGPLFHSSDLIRSVRWSQDGTRLALLISQNTSAGAQDSVQIIAADGCSSASPVITEILPTYFLFTLRGYYEDPVLPSLDWDGEDLMLWNGSLHGDGFGDLQLYNLEHSSSQTINPIQGECCYRDAQWSPDHTYIFFAYQPEDGVTLDLFYIPAESLRQTVAVDPLHFPTDFFTDAVENLQPALRTAP